MKQTLYEFGGEGKLLHLAVANGFPPQTYIPFVREFEGYRAVSLPPRPLWSDEPPPDKMLNWRDLVGQDLIDGIRAYDLTDITAIGHSFGGVATMVAAMQEPQRFRAIVILDPPILPPLKLLFMRLGRALGREASEGLESLARRRRDHFDSIKAAYENFKGKGIFREWSDETVRLYAETMQPADGGGVKLAWAKEWEAYFFRTWILYIRIWRDLAQKLPSGVPFLLVRGGKSDTFLPQAANLMKMIIPHMDYHELPEGGHLFPHTHPQQTAKLIRDWLTTLL